MSHVNLEKGLCCAVVFKDQKLQRSEIREGKETPFSNILLVITRSLANHFPSLASAVAQFTDNNLY